MASQYYESNTIKWIFYILRRYMRVRICATTVYTISHYRYISTSYYNITESRTYKDLIIIIQIFWIFILKYQFSVLISQISCQQYNLKVFVRINVRVYI